jgi:hydrogenase maturation protease
LDTLILCLGNPIVRNDQVGLLVGERIGWQIPRGRGVDVRQFTGSPLALISEVKAYARLILIDAVCTGKQPVGSVGLFTEEDLIHSGGDLFLHGLNLPAALTLGHSLGAALPSWIRLIGIEVGTIEEFGDAPAAELSEQIESIAREALSLVRTLLAGGA